VGRWVDFSERSVGSIPPQGTPCASTGATRGGVRAALAQTHGVNVQLQSLDPVRLWMLGANPDGSSVAARNSSRGLPRKDRQNLRHGRSLWGRLSTATSRAVHPKLDFSPWSESPVASRPSWTSPLGAKAQWRRATRVSACEASTPLDVISTGVAV